MDLELEGLKFPEVLFGLTPKFPFGPGLKFRPGPFGYSRAFSQKDSNWIFPSQVPLFPGRKKRVFTKNFPGTYTWVSNFFRVKGAKRNFLGVKVPDLPFGLGLVPLVWEIWASPRKSFVGLGGWEKAFRIWETGIFSFPEFLTFLGGNLGFPKPQFEGRETQVLPRVFRSLGVLIGPTRGFFYHRDAGWDFGFLLGDFLTKGLISGTFFGNLVVKRFLLVLGGQDVTRKVWGVHFPKIPTFLFSKGPPFKFREGFFPRHFFKTSPLWNSFGRAFFFRWERFPFFGPLVPQILCDGSL